MSQTLVLARCAADARPSYGAEGGAIKAGTSVGDLAAREKTTTSRIQQMIGLAFLAPDILDQVAVGRQPVAFTSEWVKRRQLPAYWDLQRQIVGGL